MPKKYWRWFVDGEEVEEAVARKQIAENLVALDENLNNPNFTYRHVEKIYGFKDAPEQSKSPQTRSDTQRQKAERERLSKLKLYEIRFKFSGYEDIVDQALFAENVDDATIRCRKKFLYPPYETEINILTIKEVN
mgnify:CR=1 FL=1